jgi:hypothetical protein
MPSTVLVRDKTTGATTARYKADAEEMVRNDPRYIIVPDSLQHEGTHGGHRKPNAPFPLQHPGSRTGETIR